MIEEQNNLGRKVRVISMTEHARQPSQSYVGQVGVVTDPHVSCPKVRFASGESADCYCEELEYVDTVPSDVAEAVNNLRAARATLLAAQDAVTEAEAELLRVVAP